MPQQATARSGYAPLTSGSDQFGLTQESIDQQRLTLERSRQEQANRDRRKKQLESYLQDIADDPISRAVATAEFDLQQEEQDRKTQQESRLKQRQKIADQYDDPVSRAAALFEFDDEQTRNLPQKQAFANREALTQLDERERTERKLDRVGLGFAPLRETIGSAVNVVPDLAAVPARAMETVGLAEPGTTNELNRQSGQFQQAREEARNDDMSPWLSRMYGGASQSVMQMAATPGGATAKIVGAGVMSANQALTTAEDAGLEGAAKARYSLEQGLAESVTALVGQKLLGGGVESRLAGQAVAAETMKQLAKNIGVDALKEMPEEVVTSILQDVSSKLEGVSPDMQVGDFVQNATDAAVQSALMAGMANAPNAATLALKKKPEVQTFIEKPSLPNYEAAVKAGMPPIENPNRGGRNALASELKKTPEPQAAQPTPAPLNPAVPTPPPVAALQPTQEAQTDTGSDSEFDFVSRMLQGIQDEKVSQEQQVQQEQQNEPRQGRENGEEVRQEVLNPAAPQEQSPPVDSPEPQAVQTQKNWRTAFDSESDPYKKTQQLRAIANMKSTPKELSDILDRVTGLEDESNIRWAIGRNPAATEEIISRAESEGSGVLTADGKIPRPKTEPQQSPQESQTSPGISTGETLPDQPSPSLADPVLEQQAPAEQPAVPAPTAPTDSGPSPKFLALPQKSQDLFNAAFESRDPAQMKQMIEKSNTAWNAEFTRRTGIKLPRAAKDKQRVVQEWVASQGGQTAPEVQQTPTNANEAVAPATTPEQHSQLPTWSVYSTRIGGKPKFAVKEFDKGGFGDGLFDTEADAQKYADTARKRAEGRLARQEKAQADDEAAKKKQQEYEASFQGFLTDDPKTKGNRLKTLDQSLKYKDKATTRKQLVEQKVSDGWTVNDQDRLQAPTGEFLDKRDLTKTGIDYAKHLIEKNKVTVATPEPAQTTADLPWRNSPVEDESKWFGTGITIAPSNRREAAYNGTVVRVLNKGDMVEVQPDGQDGTFRVSSDRITINDTPATPEPAAQPEPPTPSPVAEQPAIPAFTRTTPDKTSITRQDRADRIKEVQQKIREVETRLKARQNEYDGLRYNATNKRAAAKRDIGNLQERIRDLQTSIRRDETQSRLAELEDALESPRSYDHYLAGMAAVNKVSVDYEPDSKREAKAKKFGDELLARAVDEGKAQGLDESDAKQAASSAVAGFSADDDRPLAYFVERAAERIREMRMATPMGKLFPNKAVYGPQKTTLSNEQRDQFAEQLRAASKDDKGYAKKISEINKQIDKAIQDIKDQAADAAKKKAEADAAEKAIQEQQQLANARNRAKKYFLEKRIENALKGRKIESKTVYVRQNAKGDAVKIVEGSRTEADKKGEMYANGLILHPAFGEDSTDWAITDKQSGMGFPSIASRTNMKTLISMIDVLGIDFNVKRDAENTIPSELASRMRKVVTAWDNDDYSALNDQDRATIEALAAVPPTDIQADLILTADDIGANGIPQGLGNVMTDRGVKVVKDLTNEVVEFAYDPVFTFQGGKLVFRDGYTFKFEPKVFNLHPSELKEGQTVGINLEDMGIKRATPQDVVAEMLKSAGLPRVTKSKSGRDVTAGYVGATVSVVQGKEDNDWSVVSGPQKVKDIVVKTLEKIRWRQPGQPGEAKTDIGNANAEPSPARQAADKAKEELAAIDAENQKQIDIIKKEWNKIKGGLAQPSGFIPVTKEMADAITKLMLGQIRSGMKRFDLFIKELRVKLNDDQPILGVKPKLIETWNALQKNYGLDPATEQQFDESMANQAEPPIESAEPPIEPPIASPKPPISDSGKNLYSTQNASTSVDRAELGMPERPTRDQASREAQTAMAAALAKTEAGRKQTDDVIREVMVRPRALTVVENDLLGVRRVELKQKLRDALAKKTEAMQAGDDAQTVIWQTAVADHNAKLQEIIRILSEDASYLVGTQLQARKAWIDDQYSYERMTMEYTAAYGKEPTGEALAEIERKVRELEESQAKQQKLIDEQEAEINDLKKRLEETHNERVEEVSPAPKTAKKKVSKESEAARAKVNDTWKASIKRLGKAYSIGKAVSDSYLAFFDLAGAYAELGVTTLGDFMGRIKKRMGPDAEPFTNDITEAWKDYQSQNTAEFAKRITDKIDLEDSETIGKAARDLHRFVIQRDGLDASAAGRDAAVKAVHELLVQVVPDITPDQTARAMSGIGIYSELNKEEVEVIRRDQKAQLMLLEQIEDWKKGQAPPATGQERAPISDEQRQLRKGVNEAKKAAGIVTATAGQLRSSLDAAKRAATNRISDLTRAIDTKERIARSRKLLTPDAELTALQEQRDALQKQYNEIFGKNELSDEQKIARTEKMLDRALADMESELKAGKLYPNTPKPKLTSPAIEAKQAALDTLKALRDEMRISSGEAQARSDAAYERRQLETIEKLARRIAEKDYKTATKPPERVQTPEMLKNGLIIKKQRDQLAKDIKQWQFDNMHPVYKFWVKVPGAAMGVWRSTMLSFEMSPIGRQGRLLGGSHPVSYLKAISKAFASNFWDAKSIFPTEQDLFNTQAKLDADANWVRLEKLAKLELVEIDGGSKSEEGFQYIPDFLRKTWGFSGAERSSAAFLNTQRRLVFRTLVENFAKKLEREGRSVTNAELRVIGNAVNLPSGRADLGSWMRSLEKLSTVFLAPRWVASRALWWLGEPVWHDAKWKGGEGASAEVRKFVAIEWGKQAIAQATMIGFVVGTLQAMLGDPGDDEEWDFYSNPQHKNFGQLRVGNRYTDMTAGLSQYLSMAVRLMPYGSEQRRWETVPTDRGQVVGGFLQGKLAPVPSVVADYMFGPMTPGVEFGSKEWAVGKFTPLYAQEVIQAFSQDGKMVEKPSEQLLGAMWSTLAFFGQSSRSQEARFKERKDLMNEMRAFRNQGKPEKAFKALDDHLKHSAQLEAKEALRVVPPDADPTEVAKLNKIAAGTDSPELTDAMTKEKYDIAISAAAQLSSEDKTKKKQPKEDQSITTARAIFKEIAPTSNEAIGLFNKAYRDRNGSLTETFTDKFGRKQIRTKENVMQARRRIKAMFGGK